MARQCSWSWLAGFVALTWAGIAHGQTVPVTAGEHADFTRIVVHAPPGTTWTASEVADEYRLSITPSHAGFDLSRLFDRIPRSRLARARSDAGMLTLTIPCNCDMRAWEERPGLIVIDISDAPTPDQEPPPDQPLPLARLDPARAAGFALAQTHAQDQLRPGALPPQEPPVSLESLTETLGRPIAEALGQGLLEPSPTAQGSQPPVLLMPSGDSPPDLPQNMRVVAVMQRPDPSAPPEPPVSQTCNAARSLDFLLVPSSTDFGTAFGRLTRRLYGEFDQPDPDARRALIELYLANGFGAEARALIANDSDPVVGREPLLGMSDLLEDRNSNSLMRLAQMIDCSGPAALLAALAGAPEAGIRQAAPGIALTFSELDAPLRAILGGDLATRLMDANAADAARIVIGATRRSPYTNAHELDVLDAQLEWVRGRPADAVARLDHAQGVDMVSLQARFDLALETGLDVPPALLDHAASLASAHRNSAAGLDLMDAVARLHARNTAFQSSFDTLDRLRTWLPTDGDALNRINTLRDTLWGAVAADADDLVLMRGILNRSDWRDPDLAAPVRTSLAQRLVDLGLARQAIDLLPNAGDEMTAELLGQAYLLLDQPNRALTTLSGIQTEAGRRIRARALAALGESGLAAREFEALDSTAEARSAAILAQDWEGLQQLDGTDDLDRDAELDALGFAISRRPGYLNPTLPASPAPPPQTNGEARPLEAAAPEPTSPEALQGREPNPGGGATTPAPATIQSAPGQPALALADQTLPAASDGAATQTVDPPRPLGADTPAPDPVATSSMTAGQYDFDRLGLITRSTTLLGESERLRDTLAPLLRPTE